jgi:hypothetical protein
MTIDAALKWHALHRSDQFKQNRGDLTASERAEVIAEIASGKPRGQIAADWLLSEGRVHHIAMEHRRGVNSRGKPLKASQSPPASDGEVRDAEGAERPNQKAAE